MPKPSTVFNVLLRADISKTETELLGMFAGRVTSESGYQLLNFFCTRIDAHQPHYLWMETFMPNDPEELLHVIRVPHHFVLTILGDKERPSIGFIT